MRLKPRRISKYLLALPSFLAAMACSPSWQDQMDLAQSLQAEKRSMEAIAVYEQALEKRPQHRGAATVLLKIGNLYYVSLQQPQQALETLRKLTTEYAKRPEAREALKIQARIYEEQEVWTDAIASYAVLLERYPDHQDNAEFKYRIGKLHQQRGDLKQAQLELENFLSKHPTSPWSDAAHFQLGEIYFAVKEFPKAYEHYMTVPQQFPQSALKSNALYNAGLTLEQLGEWDQAIVIYEQLLPTHSNPQMLKRQIDQLKRRRREAGRG